MKAFYLLSILSIATLNGTIYKDFTPTQLELLQSVMPKMYHITTAELVALLDAKIEKIEHITAQELQARMARESDLRVINVLSHDWYKDCHIKDSINVPLKQLIDVVQGWDRDQPIVVYCALDVCDAGEKAFVLLTMMGFTAVADYAGGIKEWFQLGFDTQGPCVASYLHEQELRNFNCLQDEL